MSKLLLHIKEHFNSLFLYFGIIVMLTVLSIGFLVLPNNLIFSDDAWYLCLLRDVPHVGTTRFHLLFNNVFHNDIYAMRVCCWFSKLLGTVVLAIGLTCWIGRNKREVKWGRLFLLVLCVLYMGQMGIEACPSFNYITLNKVSAEIGLGFLLMGLAKHKSIFFVLSGFSIAFLFPIMITNVIIIPLMLITILLLAPQKKEGLFFLLGLGLFFVYYLLVVETPKEVVQFVASGVQSTVDKGAEDYGVKFYFLWCLETLMYLFRCFVVALIIYFVSHRVMTAGGLLKSKVLKPLVGAFISMLVLLYSWAYMEPVTLGPSFKGIGTFRWFKDLYWIFFFLLCCSDAKKNVLAKEEWVLEGLLFATVLCLCFGSNKSFAIREGPYFVFLAPVLVFKALQKSYKWKMLLLMIVSMGFAIFVYTALKGTNWSGDRHFGRKEPLSAVGICQNIKLDSQYVSRLSTCKEKIPTGERVLCSVNQWGLVALLDYKPVDYEFDFVGRNLHNVIQDKIREEVETEGHLWAVSTIQEDDFINKLLFAQGNYTMVMDTIENNIFIYISKKEE